MASTYLLDIVVLLAAAVAQPQKFRSEYYADVGEVVTHDPRP